MPPLDKVINEESKREAEDNEDVGGEEAVDLGHLGLHVYGEL